MYEGEIQIRAPEDSNNLPTLRTRDQAVSLLLTIPRELMIMILQHLVPGLQDMANMLTVCKYLNDVMEKSRVLWTYIPLDAGEHVIDAFIRRAGPDIPLDLEFDDPGPSEWLYDYVQEYMPRAKTLSMYIQSPWGEGFVKNLHAQSWKLPFLRCLTLTYYWSDMGPPAPPITRDFLGGQAAILTTLKLSGACVHGIPEVPALKTLELDETSTPLENIVDILRAAPNIQILTLIHCIGDGESDEDIGIMEHNSSTIECAISTAPLLYLKRLIIRDMSTALIASLLSHLPDPSVYMEIMETHRTNAFAVWSLSNPAADAIVQRLSQFWSKISCESEHPVSITIEVHSAGAQDSDLDDQPEALEANTNESGAMSLEKAPPKSHSTIYMGSQAGEASSSSGLFWMSGSCVSPITDPYIISRARTVTLIINDYDPQVSFDIHQHIHPSLASTVETLVLRCVRITAEYGQQWMDGAPLRDIFNWISKRHAVGTSFKTLRFENCVVALDNFKNHVVGGGLVDQVVWL